MQLSPARQDIVGIDDLQVRAARGHDDLRRAVDAGGRLQRAWHGAGGERRRGAVHQAARRGSDATDGAAAGVGPKANALRSFDSVGLLLTVAAGSGRLEPRRRGGRCLPGATFNFFRLGRADGSARQRLVDALRSSNRVARVAHVEQPL